MRVKISLEYGEIAIRERISTEKLREIEREKSGHLPSRLP
jgi:hypothetical protein